MAAVLVLATLGCGGLRDDFVGPRVLDTCNGTWPVCDRITGCLVGEQTYVEGRFPGSTTFMVKLFEPSTVRVHLFLEEVGASGEQTVITFFEDRCRARVRESATGRAFVAETEKFGEFVREADLTGTGDHLIELQSDARGRYVAKVEVIPKRPQQ